MGRVTTARVGDRTTNGKLKIHNDLSEDKQITSKDVDKSLNKDLNVDLNVDLNKDINKSSVLEYPLEKPILMNRGGGFVLNLISEKWNTDLLWTIEVLRYHKLRTISM